GDFQQIRLQIDGGNEHLFSGMIESVMDKDLQSLLNARGGATNNTHVISQKIANVLFKERYKQITDATQQLKLAKEALVSATDAVLLSEFSDGGGNNMFWERYIKAITDEIKD
ncbi:unnamed protein product, partial [Effrenium voratum]